MPVVALTGAAGLVGGICRDHWAREPPVFASGSGDGPFHLRLLDIAPLPPPVLRQHESYCRVDITALDQLTAAFEGCDYVVHFAAYPGAGPGYELGDTLSPTLLQLNVVGAYNAFEAARVAGCRRLVFCSSIGAVDGYRAQGSADTPWDAPVWPTTAYGATKCFGEALGRVYATTHGLPCVVVRLCNPGFSQSRGRTADLLVPGEAEEAEATVAHTTQLAPGDWGEMAETPQSGMSPRDCGALFASCLGCSDEQLHEEQPESTPPNFAIVNGISEHTAGWLDRQVAKRVLGFVPRDGTAFPRL